MNLTTLKDFRHEFYGYFGQAKDATWNTVDARLPELSLSPLFERRWPSLYEGMEDGEIDQQRVRPWENTQRTPTPPQVRRGMLKLVPK